MVERAEDPGRDAGDAGDLARVAAGDRAAFDGLVHRHGPALRRFARSLLGSLTRPSNSAGSAGSGAARSSSG